MESSIESLKSFGDIVRPRLGIGLALRNSPECCRRADLKVRASIAFPDANICFTNRFGLSHKSTAAEGVKKQPRLLGSAAVLIGL